MLGWYPWKACSLLGEVFLVEAGPGGVERGEAEVRMYCMREEFKHMLPSRTISCALHPLRLLEMPGISW